MTKKVVIGLTPEMKQTLDDGVTIEGSDAEEEFNDLFSMLDTLVGKKILLNERLKNLVGQGDPDSIEDYAVIYDYAYCHIFIEGSNGVKCGVPFIHGLTLDVVTDD